MPRKPNSRLYEREMKNYHERANILSPYTPFNRIDSIILKTGEKVLSRSSVMMRRI